MWFDSMAIPADAKNVAEAHEFINFMMRPRSPPRTRTSCPMRPATSPRSSSSIRRSSNNPGIYPDEATFKRLFTNTAYDERSQRTVTRLWTG